MAARPALAYQWRVVHTQHHDTLVLRAILTPSAHVRLEHVAAVQKRHLAVLLHPHLVASVRRDDAQRRNVQPELARLCEFSKTDAEREQVVARDARGEIGYGFAHVVDS